MKKYILIFSAIVLVAGCSYLDKMPDDMKTDEMVWSSRTEVKEYLTNCYAALPYDSKQMNDPWVGLADECDIPWSVYKFYSLNRGNWEPSTDFYQKWTPYYKAIRATFVLENNIDRCDELSDELKARYTGEAIFLRGYYYFCLLRQYGPVVLIKEELSNSTDYGDMQRTPFDECIDYVCECMDRAYDMLPYSYESTPEDKGRATKPACLAVKSTALLLAASPQWNGNADYANFKNSDGTLLANTTYDASKWRRAAEAAKAVIDLSEQHYAETKLGLYYAGQDVNSSSYNPFKSYYDIFNSGWNDEIIWGSIDQGALYYGNRGCRYGWMIHCIPVNGNNSTMGAVAVTLRLADAFYMENGKSIDDPSSGYVENGFTTAYGQHYNPKNYDIDTRDGRQSLIKDLKTLDSWGHDIGDWNMFANREARFYASVNYNHRVQLTYSEDTEIRNKINSPGQQDGWGRCELYYGGISNSGSGSSAYSYPHTGMLAQKGIVPCDFTNYSFDGTFVSIYIRYAQILLDYIEALNEVDPGNTDIQKYWDLIHQRAGIPSIFTCYPEIKGDQDQQREYIIRERQIELNFEGDRYYTTRRRLLSMTPDLGGETDNRKYGDSGRVWGFSVRSGDPATNNFKSTEFYQRTPLDYERVFKKAYYLFPIPQSEIDKSPGLVQNPEW